MRALAIIAIALPALVLPALVRTASADPVVDHVVSVPTAWLPQAGAVIGDAAIDRFGDGSIVLGYGLGGIAAVELGADSDVRDCAAASCAGTAPPGVYQGRAAFRLGAGQDRWFAGQPAVVFGVEVTIPIGTSRVTTAYVVVSRELGPLRVHAGAAALDAEAPHSGVQMGTAVRPLGGLELTPPQFPKSSMLADVEWLPELEGARKPIAKWIVGGGVRYQALTWGAIDLMVRVRQDDGVANSAVMVRVNGVWGQ